MGEFTLSDMDRLLALHDAERTFQMDEETFRSFYDGTARPLWAYLARLTGERRLADDLLQETYYRFLRSATSFDDDDHRRRYLFRIATNLARDHRRRPESRASVVSTDDLAEVLQARDDAGATPEAHFDVARAMRRLRPRERALLWLAYVQGLSHAEIAAALGLRTASLKALLWRARRRLLEMVKGDDASARGRS